MFLRKPRRELTCLAIAACAPLVLGCSTTRNFLVDPQSASRETITVVESQANVSVEFKQPPPIGLTARFTGGGAIDTTTMTIRGTSATGDFAAIPLAEAGDFRMLARPDGRETVEATADALLAGPSWRPDGEVQAIYLQSGKVIDARNGSAVVDARRGAVLLTAAEPDTTVVPFGEIRYLRIKDSHPGRSALCVTSLVLTGYVVIALLTGQGLPSSD